MINHEDRIKQTKESMQNFINNINIMNGDKEIAEVIFETLRYEHRTLQQSFWKVFKIVSKKYSELLDNEVDLRCEDARKYCKVITEASKECYMRFI